MDRPLFSENEPPALPVHRALSAAATAAAARQAAAAAAGSRTTPLTAMFANYGLSPVEIAAATAAPAAGAARPPTAAAASVRPQQPASSTTTVTSTATVPAATVSLVEQPDPIEEQLKRAQCPVCIEEYSNASGALLLPRALNCGHLVCSGCIVRMKTVNNGTQSVACPICRVRSKSDTMPIKEIVYFREQISLSAPFLAPINDDPIRDLRARSSGMQSKAHNACRMEVVKLREMKEQVVAQFNSAITRLSVGMASSFDVLQSLQLTTQGEAKKIEEKSMKTLSAVQKEVASIDLKTKSLRTSLFDLPSHIDFAHTDSTVVAPAKPPRPPPNPAYASQSHFSYAAYAASKKADALADAAAAAASVVGVAAAAADAAATPTTDATVLAALMKLQEQLAHMTQLIEDQRSAAAPSSAHPAEESEPKKVRK